MIAQIGCMDVEAVGMVKRVKLRQRAEFRSDRSNRCRDMSIIRFFMTAAAAILDFWILEILTVVKLKRVELRRRAKFRRNRSNRGRDMAIFRVFKMAAAAILDF